MEIALGYEAIAFDGILALSLPLLAWKLLRAEDLFKAVVLFICYGLIMSLAWVRLNAVDIALAEAAIGAGVTGALFLAALRRMQIDNMNGVDKANQKNRIRKAIAVISVMTVTAIVGWTVWLLPPFSNQMHDLVISRLSISGVENPVTAVLLNFRGYDTMLEIAVLLLAAVGVLSMAPTSVRPEELPPSPIQILLLRRLLPLIILVAGYVLWVGKYAPGGAFQAGAILAAGGVLMVTSAIRFNQSTINSIPIGLSIGLLTFLVVALATMMVDGNLLQYPVAWAGTLILLIEAAATISIAVVLTILFIGKEPEGDSTREP